MGKIYTELPDNKKKLSILEYLKLNSIVLQKLLESCRLTSFAFVLNSDGFTIYMLCQVE